MLKKSFAISDNLLIFAANYDRNNVSAKAHTETPAIRFAYEKDGRMSVAVVGKELEYQGAFDRDKVVAAVRRLGLGLKDRASLYLRAADYCQDDEVAEVLLALGEGCAERAGRIDTVRQQYNIPLTPIGDVSFHVNGPLGQGLNEGWVAVPPSTVERFHPQLPVAITDKVVEHMVRALEGHYVPYNRGEMALRAFGLLSGEMACYIDWIGGLQSLVALTLLLLGRVSFKLKDDETMNEKLLPAGSYGNGTAVVAQRRGHGGHWQTVCALFRVSNDKMLNSASLRTTAARLDEERGEDYLDMLYLLHPLMFDADHKAKPNGLYRPKGVG